MSAKVSLRIALVISLAGAAFSGVLTWRELALHAPGGCSAVGAPGTIFGYPPCVYGLVMYLLLVVVTALGLRSADRGTRPPPG
ncbi:MAG TPA: hypothetical protein VLC11_08035 [Gemmatimonadales bacterium]|nr:hypothetical protein [Gemmatimonadales bacterium]